MANDSKIVEWMVMRLAEVIGEGREPEGLAVMQSLVAKLQAATVEDKADLSEEEAKCLAGAVHAWIQETI